jgi:hypothetical protein
MNRGVGGRVGESTLGGGRRRRQEGVARATPGATLGLVGMAVVMLAALAGCSSSSSPSSDDCATACNQASTAGCLDGGTAQCVAQCKNPSTAGVPAACTSTFNALVHCEATNGPPNCSGTTTLSAACASQELAFAACAFANLDAGFTFGPDGGFTD